MWAFVVAAVIFFVGWIIHIVDLKLGAGLIGPGFTLLGLGFIALGLALRKP